MERVSDGSSGPRLESGWREAGVKPHGSPGRNQGPPRIGVEGRDWPAASGCLRSSAREAIATSDRVPDSARARVLQILETLPDGDRLCHLDFHPGNVIEGPEVDVSASDIRHRAARGESLDGLVPPGVAALIRDDRLYRQPQPTEDSSPVTEPLPSDSPLRGLDNLLITSHLAGQTIQARTRAGLAAAHAVIDVLENRNPAHPVDR